MAATTTTPRVVYSDCSVRAGVAVAAWYIDRKSFGAMCVAASNSNVAETLAALLAINSSTGSVVITTDSRVLCDSINLDPTSKAWAQAITLNPVLPELKRRIEERGASIMWAKGHGTTTPRGLKFCDILSRAVSRRASYLDLRVGDSIDCAPVHPTPSTTQRVRVPACPSRTSPLRHLNREIVPNLVS